MLYKIAHFFRDNLPFVWDLIDILNSYLFYMIYGRKLKTIEQVILNEYALKSGFQVKRMKEVQIERIVDFFSAQPDDAYTFFKPHGFDIKSLKRMQSNRSFLAYFLIDGNHIAAYCFVRSFFLGKGYRGRMVGIDYRGNGLGTLVNRLMNAVGFGIGLRLFETVSKDNVASYRSALSASKVKVVEELENNELYLEVLKED